MMCLDRFVVWALLIFSIIELVIASECPYDYDDPRGWSSDCPSSNCDGPKQSPVDVDTAAVQACHGRLEFSSDYEDDLYGRYERNGFLLQFVLRNWTTEAPSVTQSHSMHDAAYRQVYNGGKKY